MQFDRYAVYYLPPDGPLADFGAAWLGWDVASGQPRAHPVLPGLPADPAWLTDEARRYGFHATLKPPFRLADGSTEAAVLDDLHRLVATIAPAWNEALAPALIGGFAALVPQGNATALNDVAAALVVGLDHHRAPAPANELARRRAAGLNAAQEAHLIRWGYPYVMDQFHLHLTLSRRLPPDQGAQLLTALAPVLEPLCPAPFVLDQVALVGQRDDGFHLIQRVALTG